MVLYPPHPPHFMPYGWNLTSPLCPQSLHWMANLRSSCIGFASITASISEVCRFKLLGGSIVLRHSGQFIRFCWRHWIMQCTWMGCPHAGTCAGLMEWNKFSRQTGQSVLNRLALHTWSSETTHVPQLSQCMKLLLPMTRQMPHLSQW